jgi:hypothetical protein
VDRGDYLGTLRNLVGSVMSDDPPTNGMLSKAQKKAVEAASGAEFGRLWLHGMIGSRRWPTTSWQRREAKSA